MGINFSKTAGSAGREQMYVGMGLYRKTRPIPMSKALSLGLSLQAEVSAVKDLSHLRQNFGSLSREHVSRITNIADAEIKFPDNCVRVPLVILESGLDTANLNGEVKVAYAGAGIKDKHIPRTLSDLSFVLRTLEASDTQETIDIAKLLKPNRFGSFKGKPLFVRSIPTKVDLSGASAWISIGDHKNAIPAIYFYINMIPALDHKDVEGAGKLVLSVDLPMLKFANLKRAQVFGNIG